MRIELWMEVTGRLGLGRGNWQRKVKKAPERKTGKGGRAGDGRDRLQSMEKK
jgi:hypothetical protein